LQLLPVRPFSDIGKYISVFLSQPKYFVLVECCLSALGADEQESRDDGDEDDDDDWNFITPARPRKRKKPSTFVGPPSFR